MEKATRPFKLTFQAGFTYDSRQKRISFSESPAGIIPALNSTNLEFKEFVAYFIEADEQRVKNFFAPETWSENQSFFTVSTVPENYLQGESSSIMIQQNGKEADETMFGVIINITPFMPSGMLYQDLERFTERLSTMRVLTHDLNNQFQIITGFGSMLEDDLQDPEQKDNATQVMNAVNKSVDLTKELRDFFPPKIKPRLFMPERLLQASPNAALTSSTNIASPADTATDETDTGILVIDDEPLVQRFLCEMLKRLKHRVLGCSNGKEALKHLKDNSAKYNLAVVDVNLPDISSENLYEQLKKLKPELKVLLISGEDPDEMINRILARGANGFLQKPTTIKDLGDSITAILAR